MADYRARCALYARPFDGMADLLAALRAQGVRIGIVTNDEAIFQQPHIAALGLDRAADAILISEAEGLRKPDIRIFRRAAARLGVGPAGCLFVGDDPVADIAGAAAAGMQTVWLRHGRQWPPRLEPNRVAIDRLEQLLSLLDMRHPGAVGLNSG